MARSRRNWDGAKVVEERRRWLLSDNEHENTEQCVRLMKEAPNAFAAAASAQGVGARLASNGLVAVFDNDALGWHDIYRFFLIYAWKEYVRCELTDTLTRAKRPLWQGLQVNTFGFSLWTFCIAFALCANNRPYSTWAASRLSRAIGEEPDPIMDRKRLNLEYAGVLLWLHSISFGKPFEEYRGGVSAYRSISESWADDEAFRQALRAACDYHCDESFKADSVFDTPVASVIPAEILAIMQIRTMSGLSTPRIDHPLLMTPLADFRPDLVAGVKPLELFDRVVAKSRSMLPGLDLDFW